MFSHEILIYINIIKLLVSKCRHHQSTTIVGELMFVLYLKNIKSIDNKYINIFSK